MILGNEFFRDGRVLDALTNLAREVIRHQFVGLAIRQDIPEIAHPDAETWFAIELFPERFPFRLGNLEHRTGVGGMDEAAHGFLAAREDIGVVLADLPHLLGRDLGIVQRCRPLRGTLEHGQLAGGFRDLRDGLNTGRAGADHRDALAGETDRLFGPVMCVMGLALEALDTGNARHGRCRQHADRGDQQPRRALRAIV